MKHLGIILGLVLIAALAISDEKFVEKRVVAAVDPDGVQRVAMTGGEYYFDPNVIVVKVNVPVELTVKKEAGITPHDISVKAPEAGIDFKTDLSTEPKSIKFTPTKAGKYPFECNKRFLFFKSHKDRGMHGVLEVVE
jgi:plastocyanin domain-containing protein